MLKLIVGTKGSGKTKTMIDMIDKAVKTTSGNIVVIEKCMKLTTEINHSARLVDVDEYGVAGADMLYGFVAGVLAGNYDITELFLDGILRITDHDMAAAAKVLNAIDKITSNIEVVVTVSADAAELPEDLKNMKFDKTLSKQIVRFLKKNDPKMIFIYGQNDPWTAAGVTWLKDKKNIHVFVEPGGSHLARIGTMPEDQKQKVMSLLKGWLEE